MPHLDLPAHTDSGIGELGAIPWGSHLCHLYSGDDDLANVIVPFLRAGLLNNEQCIWVAGDGVTHVRLLSAFARAISGVERYQESGQLEIVPYTDVYLRDGCFDQASVLTRWVERSRQALDRGYAGLRVTGDPFWLKTEQEWTDFLQYEEAVERAIGSHRIVALCTYGLRQCGPKELFGIAKTHSASFMRTLHGAVVAALVQEADDALRLHTRILEQSSDGVCLVRARDGVILQTNQKFDSMFGYPAGDRIGQPVTVLNAESSEDTAQAIIRKLHVDGVWKGEILHRRRDGATFWSEATVSRFHHARYGEVWVSVHADVTERKQTEQRLARYARQLEILSETSRLINSQRDIHEIMRTLVSSAMQVVEATAGMYGLLENGELVYHEYHREEEVVPINYTFCRGYGVPGWVLEHRALYVCNDAEQDPHVIPEIHRQLQFYNFVNVPILDRRGELLGSFEILDKKDRQPFDAGDLSVLEGLAASAAVALENARLFEDRQRAEAVLEKTNRELEDRVGARTRELRAANSLLEEKVRELEAFHDVVVDRELKMIELEREIERLRKEREKAPPSVH
ncbi:MEDS domain-containing protein [Candidatus Nitrospira bockiana]